ncbi:MAG: ribose-5-phosphate isomerase RpiA [Gammaproteobacteria bacterium]
MLNLKKILAEYVFKNYLQNLEDLEEGLVIGLGTGSTLNELLPFIANIPHFQYKNFSFVASSIMTQNLAEHHGIRVLEFNQVKGIDLYIDGADACNSIGQLIKGHGGALTREKILAAASKQFVCMVDYSKVQEDLSNIALPIEVLPFARSFVARELLKLGADPVWKENFVSDNHNQILHAKFRSIPKPQELEQQINLIPGVVDNGLFCTNKPQTILIAQISGGIRRLKI